VGGQSELPRVYRNDVAAGGNGFALRLHGTTSNHLGMGAQVTVWPESASAPQYYVMGGVASPYQFSQPLVFVGLGAATSAARVRVTWPSGTVQELVDVAAAQIHDVTEPAVVIVDPPSRHLPADGASFATVTITPRDPNGSLRAATTVELTRLDGGAPAPIAVTRDGDTWTAQVLAPATAGSTAIETRIDGVVVGISPRIFWDAPPSSVRRRRR
jgi:hypothetical protein